MRILLIEDDEALRTVLIPVLEKAGFGCDSAADGASGLALLLQNPYDAAVVEAEGDGRRNNLAVYRRSKGLSPQVHTAREEICVCS